MKHLNRLLAGSAAALLLFSLPGEAEAVGRTYIDNTVVEKSGGGTIILVLAMTLLLFGCLIWIVKQGKSGRLHVPWAVLSLLFFFAAVFLCILSSASDNGSLYTNPSGDPADTVKAFYDSIISRDYEAAYACLHDYASLGLETEPKSDNARLAHEALLSSFAYSLTGVQKVNGLDAQVEVRFRYLDIPSFEKSVASRTTEKLDELAKSDEASAYFDENGACLPGVTEQAYADALAFVLNKADTYYSLQLLTVKLKFVDGSWQILTDKDMLRPLTGGTAYNG